MRILDNITAEQKAKIAIWGIPIYLGIAIVGFTAGIWWAIKSAIFFGIPILVLIAIIIVAGNKYNWGDSWE